MHSTILFKIECCLTYGDETKTMQPAYGWVLVFFLPAVNTIPEREGIHFCLNGGLHRHGILAIHVLVTG